MFSLPELAPVDYRLRHVKPTVQSDEVFTPMCPPRVTLPSLALYAYPIPNVDGEYVIKRVPSKILDRWCQKLKAEWVPRPGTNANFMFDVFKKFYKEPGELDPRFQRKPTIFPRSYKWELDCIKSNRMRLLETKMVLEDIQETKPECDCLETGDGHPGKPIRWVDRPKLFAKSQSDPCIRRQEFALCGQPFMNEACNFYYKYYQPRKLPLMTEKFS